MAIKRLKPIQDTFIVETESEASFGADEILELGTCERIDAEGCSRILMEFMVNEVEALLGHHGLVRATLNLKFANAFNLPPVWGIDVTELASEWAEGVGHVYDMPGNTKGASWFRPKGTEKEDRWEGGLDETQDYIWKHEYFTGYQAERDICIDVTEWVYSWLYSDAPGLGFLLKLSNEDLAKEMKTRICFYSSETHTISSPYLEIIYDDSSVDLEESSCENIAHPDRVIVEAKNLKESYYIGEKTRIDVSARPEYPPRLYSTSSLYADTKAFVPGMLWGIRDEYTGEMWVNFNDPGTKCSFDNMGNYFVLDTDLLEPERYYRLAFEVEYDHRRRVFDSKNVFRVTKHGEI